MVGGICGSVGGCLGFGGTAESVDVGVENRDSTARTITVEIQFEVETLLEDTMTVEPSETATTAFENPDTAGEASVAATAATGVEASRTVRVGPGTGIRGITVVVGQDGSLRVGASRT